MNARQIHLLEQTVLHANERIPVAFIADSPWIPGYCGHSFVDYYAGNEVWINDNRKIVKDFPDAVFVPGWWVEYGMTAEPSGFGCPLCFYDDNMPHLHPLSEDLDHARSLFQSLRLPDPKRDGLMPWILNQQRRFQPVLEKEGEQVYMVCARGPFTVASHIFTVTQLLLLMMTDPEAADILLRKTTDCVKLWLEAQLENVRTAQAILVLDDVCGYFAPEEFQMYCLPYMKEIFGSFPELRHYFHNDFTSDACYPYLREMGVDVFNFTHTQSIGSVRQSVGKQTVLMGNVPPMSLLSDHPEEVYALTRSMIEEYVRVNGDFRGLVVSTGGGLPMGARQENIHAMISAVRDYNANLR